MKMEQISERICPEKIKRRLLTRQMGREVYYIEETESTNVWARQLGKEGAPSGSLAITDHQTQGRGRRGRKWVAPQGLDIFMTLLLRPNILPAQAPMLTPVMGLSVAEALNKSFDITCRIKWPNDVILNGKKVCGALTEMSAGQDGVKYVIIGVGINCNTTAFSPELSDKATSLVIESGQKIVREQLVAEVLWNFEKNYQEFLATMDLSRLAEAYNKILINKDKEVKVLETGGEFTGIARGINSKGELLVDTGDEVQKKIIAGEVSVRGLYGYI